MSQLQLVVVHGADGRDECVAVVGGRGFGGREFGRFDGEGFLARGDGGCQRRGREWFSGEISGTDMWQDDCGSIG